MREFTRTIEAAHPDPYTGGGANWSGASFDHLAAGFALLGAHAQLECSSCHTLPDMGLVRAAPPAESREMLGDGAFGGPWQRSDDEMLALWATGVAETRAALEGPWPELRA